jgi:Fe2+ transport system protein FeoA
MNDSTQQHHISGWRDSMDSSLDSLAPDSRDGVQLERRVPLADLAVGRNAIICETQCDQQATDMLCAMGLRPSACIRLMRCGKPCIVHVMGRHGCCCRIGLQAQLAEQIMVEPLSLDSDGADVTR